MIVFKIKNIVWVGFLLGVLSIFVASGNAVAAKFKGERWAVVIGVEKYKSPIPDLKSPIKDATAFYQHLKSPAGGGFDDSHIKFLTGKGVTSSSIRTVLGNFLNQVNKKDYVVIYLSGHGMVSPGNTSRYYYLPSEANAENLAGTAIRMDDIFRLVRESPAAKKLIIADVCHSGAISAQGPTKGTNAVNEHLKSLAKAYDGLSVLTSSMATQLSHEFKEKDKSVFTYFLLQALGPKANEVDGKGGKRDGVIDIKEAYEWVRDQVKQHTRAAQIPDFKGDLEIGIPLAVVSGGAKPAENNRQPFREPPTSNTINLQMENEYWSSIKQSRNAQDFKDYMTKFGKNGFFYSLAKRRYDTLAKNTTVAPSNQRNLRASTPPGMVKIPAGKFWMGTEGDAGDEGPRHEVMVDEFFMDKYEVSQADFERVMGTNPSQFKGPKRPVDSVTWGEAKEYCEKVGKRLPTEAEWEKAAKGGDDYLYPWGNRFESGYGNFCDVNCVYDWKRKEYDDGYKETSPVGSYKANGYGLYDMGGNVWEWVGDWYAKDAYKDRNKARNPEGPSSGKQKVLRGGSWDYSPDNLRTANRLGSDPALRSNGLGFRCTQ